MTAPDSLVSAWLTEVLGPHQIVADFAHSHATSRLWRIRAGSHHVWLKVNSQPTKGMGEAFALTQWGLMIGLTPTVIAYRPDLAALLLTEMPGRVAESFEPGPSEEARLWSEAGAWLARLHQIEGAWFGAATPDGRPLGDAECDPGRFVQATIERRLAEARSQSLLASDEIHNVAAAMRDWLPSLQGEVPRAVHRDFSPRNWMADSEGGLTGVIDFDHSRWDVRAADLNRWWDHEFVRRPELEAIFFDSYGGIDERTCAQIQVLRLLQYVAGYVWATSVGEVDFANRNRSSLLQLMHASG